MYKKNNFVNIISYIYFLLIMLILAFQQFNRLFGCLLHDAKCVYIICILVSISPIYFFKYLKVSFLQVLIGDESRSTVVRKSVRKILNSEAINTQGTSSLKSTAKLKALSLKMLFKKVMNDNCSKIYALK